MCDCVSWLRHRETGEVLFLRDDEAQTLVDEGTDLCDLTGHYAIFRYYKIGRNDQPGFVRRAEYLQLENTPTHGGPRIPNIIAKAINRGELKELLTAWYDANGIAQSHRTYCVTARGQWAKTPAIIAENRRKYADAGITPRTKYIRLVGYHDPHPDNPAGYVNWNATMTRLVKAGAILRIDSIVKVHVRRDPTTSEEVLTGGVLTGQARGVTVATTWSWGRQCYVPATEQEYKDFWEKPKM